MNRYEIVTLPSFERELRKLKQKQLIFKVQQVLKLLSRDPFSPALRTHLVNTPTKGKVWSSRVTGDIRVLWVFDKDKNLVIVVFRVGGHK